MDMKRVKLCFSMHHHYPNIIICLFIYVTNCSIHVKDCARIHKTVAKSKCNSSMVRDYRPCMLWLMVSDTTFNRFEWSGIEDLDCHIVNQTMRAITLSRQAGN